MLRTTVALPEADYREAQEAARENGKSLSKTLAEMIHRDLVRSRKPAEVIPDSQTGLPVLHLDTDHVFTVEEVEEAIAEDWYE